MSLEPTMTGPSLAIAYEIRAAWPQLPLALGYKIGNLLPDPAAEFYAQMSARERRYKAVKTQWCQALAASGNPSWEQQTDYMAFLGKEQRTHEHLHIPAPQEAYLRSFSPWITRISLNWQRVNDVMLTQLASICPALKELSLPGTSLLFDRNYEDEHAELARFTELETLNLSFNIFVATDSRIVEDGLSPLRYVATLQKLKTLKLVNVLHRRDVAMQVSDLAILGALPQLTTLDISSYDNNFPSSVGCAVEQAAVFQEMKALKTLVMRNCGSVRPEFLARLTELCPNLTVTCN